MEILLIPHTAIAENMAEGLAGALSGAVVEVWGYTRLTLLAAIATVPLIALLRQERRGWSKPARCGPLL